MLGAIFLVLASRASASIYTVTSNADSGTSSLRDAILQANTNPGPDVINFTLPGVTLPHSITLLSNLPTITEEVIIDGTTQSDYAFFTPTVRINCNNQSTGLRLSTGNSTIRGLVLNNFSSYGIWIDTGSSNTVQGCYIGTTTDGTGTFASGSAQTGIAIYSSNNLIGGTTTATRNLIGGNNTGIGLAQPGTGNVITGNYIGTDKGGTTPISNTTGIAINTSNTRVGGSAPGEGNIISGNITYNLAMFQDSSNTVIQGNIIGPDRTGMFGVGNTITGLHGQATTSVTLGGINPGEGNLISGCHGEVGIQGIGTLTTDDWNIWGNRIGINAAGTGPVSGQANGTGIYLMLGAHDVRIGGTNPAMANTIAYGGGGGVIVESNRYQVSILGNRIHSNLGLGIDLNNDLVANPNDANDADTGANLLQNFPVLTYSHNNTGNTRISGQLTSTPNSSFRIEYFSNASCAGSGKSEGQTFIGFSNVTTNASGVATISEFMPNFAGSVLTATATDASGNTSEFSACAAATLADAKNWELFY